MIPGRRYFCLCALQSGGCVIHYRMPEVLGLYDQGASWPLLEPRNIVFPVDLQDFHSLIAVLCSESTKIRSCSQVHRFGLLAFFRYFLDRTRIRWADICGDKCIGQYYEWAALKHCRKF